MTIYDADAIARYLLETFPDVATDTTTPDTFFFRGEERRFPFATIVTRDHESDSLSKLDREGVFRLNLGLGKETFAALCERQDAPDYAAFDRIMPHPVYGKMRWVCVLNPSSEMFETLKPLMAEAYERAGARA